MNEKRLGESKLNSSGERITIVEYNSYSDTVIEFENGYKQKATYNQFKKGTIKNYSTRTGEININTQGLKMWIKDYRKTNDIDIEFEDGFISYHKSYSNFKIGQIFNSNFKASDFKDRTGEINYNKYGSKMTIIEYNGTKDIVVKFDNGDYTIRKTYGEFKNGSISNPYDKTVYDVGFMGEGNYKSLNDGEVNKYYSTWRRMMQRCYDGKFKIKNPTYKDAQVCEEWHNFQNFSQWFEKNYYEIDEQQMDLDKDILIKGNKVYSPETCVFVPHNINMIFVKCDKVRGNLPIGVLYNKDCHDYECRLSKVAINEKRVSLLGHFDNPIDAFYKYKYEKEKYIKQVADKYKNQIPNNLYEAMCNWIVEIDD